MRPSARETASQVFLRDFSEKVRGKKRKKVREEPGYIGVFAKQTNKTKTKNTNKEKIVKTKDYC